MASTQKTPADSAQLDAMRQACVKILKNAYAPYSNFSVAACVRSTSGALYTACNTENAAYPLSSCAEANAVGMLASAGERNIAEVMVLTETDKPTPPCGGCLQRLLEFATDTTIVHCCTLNNQEIMQCTLSELMPYAFSATNLGQQDD